MKWLREYWIIICITLASGVLRFTNLNWDSGGRLHPDEALIVNGAITVKLFTNLFPGFHDYNGVSIYLLKIISIGTAFFLRNRYWTETAEGVTIVGRFLSALLATTSVPLLYLVGKRLWNKEAGIVAAALLSATPMLIQLAHFYTTESILIFLLILLLHAIILYVQNPGSFSLVRISILTGLLLATKNTAYLFLPVPLMAILLYSKNLMHKVRAIGLMSFGTIVVFCLASPYSLIDLSGYLERSRYLADVVSGRLLMDWTVQFQETTWLFWISSLLYAVGPLVIFGLTGIAGRILQKKIRPDLSFIFALWSVGFLVFLGYTYLKFTRYAAPLLPLFSLFAAKLLTDIRKTRSGSVIFYGAIITQILWGLMFFSIYTTAHTSLSATGWIRDHVPTSSVIFIEEWNSIIRFSRPELLKNTYGFLTFNFYTLPDDAGKNQLLQDALMKSNYIILESPKVKNTITRLRGRYPYSAAFYENVENGKLGFTKVAEFASYPKFGPIIIHDEAAEETFTVFDHPTVRIYKKIYSGPDGPPTSVLR